MTTRLVDTVSTPMLIRAVQSGNLQPGKLVTHRFALDEILKAYDTFSNAAKHGALKVVGIEVRLNLHRSPTGPE